MVSLKERDSEVEESAMIEMLGPIFYHCGILYVKAVKFPCHSIS